MEHDDYQFLITQETIMVFCSPNQVTIRWIIYKFIIIVEMEYNYGLNQKTIVSTI